MATEQSASARLNELLVSAGLPELDTRLAGQFQMYAEVLMRWNARLNLTAVRDLEGILSRHFLESIACARAVPHGVATLVDFGSGAGFPGIPIALCRPEIQVTLAESQAKKAAFLHEAARTLRLSARVFAGRAEELHSIFDCVALRAVDRMEKAVQAAAKLVSPGGWLMLMTTAAGLQSLQAEAGEAFSWGLPSELPLSETRLIAMGRRDIVS